MTGVQTCALPIFGFRAVIAVVTGGQSPDLPLDRKTGLYEALFDFKHLPDIDRFPILALEWGIRPCGKDDFSMTLPSGSTIVLGLGLHIDFESVDWILGSISLRRQWLLRGLMVVNSNNPIDDNGAEEVIAFLKNNSQIPALLTRKERPFQIHFQQVLVSPNVTLS